MSDVLGSQLMKLAKAYGAGDEHGIHEHTGSVVKAAIDANIDGVAQAMLDGLKIRGIKIKAVPVKTEQE